MSKIQHFSACQGEEYFTARPHPSRRGGFSFIPVTRLPHRQVTTGPARLHQRPSGIKLAQHAQNTPKTAFFRQHGEFCLGLTQNPLLFGEFFALMGATAASQHPPTTSPETDGTTASSLAHTFETADTSARTKQPNSGHFPPAKVSRVSCTPRRAPAKASPVSSDAKSGLLVPGKVLRCSCLLPPRWPW